MNPVTLVILLMISCFLASMVQSTVSLGYTIVTAGLLPLFLPYKPASLIALISAIAVLLVTSYSFRKAINYRLLALPLIMSLVGRSISLWLMTRLDDRYLLKFSGIFLILISIYLAFFSDKVHLKPTKLNGILVGFVAGIFGGLTNISGPVFVVYYLPAAKSREEFSGTLQLSFMAGCIFTLTVNFFRGNITPQILGLGALGALAAIVGVFLGLKIYSRINQKTLRRLICLMIVLMGITQLIGK